MVVSCAGTYVLIEISKILLKLQNLLSFKKMFNSLTGWEIISTKLATVNPELKS